MTELTLAQLAARTGGRAVPAEALAAVMPAVRVLAIAGVREHFQTQTAPDGKKWKALRHGRVGGGGGPLNDTGRLKASVGATIDRDRLLLTASHPGANLHQFGGVVRPKRAKMLAIPVTKEAKRIGSPRQNKFPRPLFVHAKGDRAVLAEAASDGTLTVHYVLRRSVTVPARPFLGFSERTQAKIDKLVQDRVVAWILKTMYGIGE